jgi:hypothetical protein
VREHNAGGLVHAYDGDGVASVVIGPGHHEADASLKQPPCGLGGGGEETDVQVLGPQPVGGSPLGSAPIGDFGCEVVDRDIDMTSR